MIFQAISLFFKVKGVFMFCKNNKSKIFHYNLIKKSFCLFLSIAVAGIMLPNCCFSNSFAFADAKQESEGIHEIEEGNLEEDSFNDEEEANDDLDESCQTSEINDIFGNSTNSEERDGNLHFSTNTADGKLPNGIKAYKKDYAWEEKQLPHDEWIGFNNKIKKHENKDGYLCCLEHNNPEGGMGLTYWGFKFNTVLYNAKWQYSLHEEGPYQDLGSETVSVSDAEYWFMFLIMPAVSFSTDINIADPQTEADFCWQKSGASSPSVIELKQTGVYAYNDTFKKVEAPAGYDGGLKVGGDLYCFRFHSEQYSDVRYKILKWTYQKRGQPEKEVTEDEVVLGDHVQCHFKAYIGIKVGFSYDSNLGTVSKVGSDPGVDYGYYSTGTTFSINDKLDEIVVGDDTYKAYPNEAVAARFGNWSQDSGTVENSAINIAAIFGIGRMFNFTSNLDDSFSVSGVNFYRQQHSGDNPTIANLRWNYFVQDDSDIAKFSLTSDYGDLKGGLKIGDSSYWFSIPKTDNVDNYVFDKWTYINNDGQELPVEESQTYECLDNYQFKVYFKVRTDFVSDNPNIGLINGSASVTSYALANSAITVDSEDRSKLYIQNGEDPITIEATTVSEEYQLFKWNNIKDNVGATFFTITANFVTAPSLHFEIDSDGEDVSNYLNIINDETGQAIDITKPVPNVLAGSSFNVDPDNKIKIIIGNHSYSANILNSHYVDFSDENFVWFHNDKEIGTEPVEIGAGDNIALVVKAKRIDNLSVSGAVKCGASTLQNSKVRAVVSVESTSYSLLADAKDGSFVFENIPHEVSVVIYAACQNYNIGQITVGVDDSSKSNQNVNLEEEYSFVHGGIAQSVWKDSRDLKTINISGSVSTPEDSSYYVFEAGSSLKLKAKSGDKFSFGALTTDDETGVNIKIGNQEKYFNCYTDATLTASDISDEYVTISFISQTKLDFITINAADRVITFAVSHAEGSQAGGSFSVASVTVPGMGATCSVNPGNTSELKFSNGVTVTAAADDNSIYRRWNVEGTYNLVEDEVITAQFVQKFVTLKLDKGQSPVEADVCPSDFTIPIDSVFSQQRTSLSSGIAKFTIGQQAKEAEIKITDSSKIIKYKFNESVFVQPKYTLINESNYPDIEKNGFKLVYQIQEKDPIIVTLALGEGSPAEGFSPTPVPLEIGGAGSDGKWSYDAQKHVWTNSFYEEYPIDGDTGVLTYLPKNETNITKHDGFFTGQWDGAKEGLLTTDTSLWTALYDDAIHISGKVTDSASTLLTNVNINIFATDQSYIDPYSQTLFTTSDDKGSYDFKVYSNKSYMLDAGDKDHIICFEETENLTADTVVNFTLENGYTWLPLDDDYTNNTWRSHYSNDVILTCESGSISENQFVLPESQLLSYPNSGIKHVGDKFDIYATGAVSATVNNGFDENLTFSSDKLEYTIWNTAQGFSIKPNADDLKISKIDFHLENDNYVSYGGIVKDSQTQNPISDVQVKYSSSEMNQTIETTTNENGGFYIICKGSLVGSVTLVKDHYLDIKNDVNITTGSVSVVEDLEEAIHISGKVFQQKPGTTEYVPAENVTVTFSDQSLISWPVSTSSDGSYLLKVKKGSTGSVFYYKAGYAEDGRSFSSPLSSDKSIGDVFLYLAGATVSISALDQEAHDHFIVDFYENDIKYLSKNYDSTEPTVFALDGKFSSGYDNKGNHILEYDFPDTNFHITMTPIAKKDYCFWSWSYLDPDSKRHILTDETKVIGPLEAGTEYKFMVDYSKSNDFTFNGKSVDGHGGWDSSVYINGILSFTKTFAPDEPITFSIPADNQESNSSEDINSVYYFDGENFVIEINSEFEKADGSGKQPYNEKRIYKPIPADGYVLTAIAANDIELATGQIHPIMAEAPLNVVPKYSIINNVNAQTGDDNNIMYLIALAILAILSMAYSTRRNKYRVHLDF